jgi:hypothetical protein
MKNKFRQLINAIKPYVPSKKILFLTGCFIMGSYTAGFWFGLGLSSSYNPITINVQAD